MVNNRLIYNKIYSQQTLNRRKRLLKKKQTAHCNAFLFLFVSKCFVNGFVERLLRVYIAEFQCIVLTPQQFNTFRPACKSAGIRHVNCMSGIYYFDELMKVYISIKNNSGLHPHQTLNKRIWLIKRENGHSLIHRFSFGERFDERLLSLYLSGFQYIKSSIHQFIGFPSLIKSAVKATGVSVAISRPVRQTSGLPTDNERPTPLAKRATNIRRHHADTAAGFWEAKSHSSLGRFLHAPLTLILKTPQ